METLSGNNNINYIKSMLEKKLRLRTPSGTIIPVFKLPTDCITDCITDNYDTISELDVLSDYSSGSDDSLPPLENYSDEGMEEIDSGEMLDFHNRTKNTDVIYNKICDKSTNTDTEFKSAEFLNEHHISIQKQRDDKILNFVKYVMNMGNVHKVKDFELDISRIFRNKNLTKGGYPQDILHLYNILNDNKEYFAEIYDYISSEEYKNKSEEPRIRRSDAITYNNIVDIVKNYSLKKQWVSINDYLNNNEINYILYLNSFPEEVLKMIIDNNQVLIFERFLKNNTLTNYLENNPEDKDTLIRYCIRSNKAQFLNWYCYDSIRFLEYSIECDSYECFYYLLSKYKSTYDKYLNAMELLIYRQLNAKNFIKKYYFIILDELSFTREECDKILLNIAKKVDINTLKTYYDYKYLVDTAIEYNDYNILEYLLKNQSEFDEKVDIKKIINYNNIELIKVIIKSVELEPDILWDIIKNVDSVELIKLAASLLQNEL